MFTCRSHLYSSVSLASVSTQALRCLRLSTHGRDDALGFLNASFLVFPQRVLFLVLTTL